MKNMLDNWYGGKVTRREEMQQKMRALVYTGNAMQEAEAAIEAYNNLPPVQKLENAISAKKDSKYKVIQNETSAPYVGERY